MITFNEARAGGPGYDLATQRGYVWLALDMEHNGIHFKLDFLGHYDMYMAILKFKGVELDDDVVLPSYKAKFRKYLFRARLI